MRGIAAASWRARASARKIRYGAPSSFLCGILLERRFGMQQRAARSSSARCGCQGSASFQSGHGSRLHDSRCHAVDRRAVKCHGSRTEGTAAVDHLPRSSRSGFGRETSGLAHIAHGQRTASSTLSRLMRRHARHCWRGAPCSRCPDSRCDSGCAVVGVSVPLGRRFP